MEEKTISLERFYYAAAWNGILSYWLLLVMMRLNLRTAGDGGEENFAKGRCGA
jgi:hypothetical protein